MTHAIELHLRARVAPGKRADFLAFLREAVPFYESPGGIRVRVLFDREDPDRFVEVIEYATVDIQDRDQQRVEHDPEMRSFLERWRALLDGPVTVERYDLVVP
ncbi:MAG: antibiotic biosynthesis monooxygenase [Phycisphaerales bacterium]